MIESASSATQDAMLDPASPSIVIYRNYAFKKYNILKNGNIHYRCRSTNCNASINVDSDMVMKTNNKPHNHDPLSDISPSKKLVMSPLRDSSVLTMNNIVNNINDEINSINKPAVISK